MPIIISPTNSSKSIESPESHGRGLGGELPGGFFEELEMPKLMRKKRKPLRSELKRDMVDLRSEYRIAAITGRR